MSEKKDSEGEIVFEVFDDDLLVEDIEEPTANALLEYKSIDFENELNDEQLEIVNNLGGPMLVIAGAGSGKTRTIVYAVAKLLLSGIKPNEIMLVTFTNKAANEMISRVKELLGSKPRGIWAGTFHSQANRFIRMFAETIGIKPNYNIMDELDARELMKIAIQHTGIKDSNLKLPSERICKAILSYSINCNKTIKEVLEWKFDQFNNEEIHNKLNLVFKNYAKLKAKNNLVDFDDLLLYWSQLLDERAVAKFLAQKIKYILVDEYQDTNYMQDNIIYKIVSQNPEKNIVAVGDDAQSIYSFRGANFENILNFKKKYEGCREFHITYNYRSTPEILELANDSIKHNIKQFKKKMKPTRKSGLKPYHVIAKDIYEQAKFIALQISNLHDKGFKYKQIAVLFRAAYHSLQIEMELKLEGIPYEVRAGLSFFERAHIKDLLAHLRLIENPFDELAWRRIFKIIPGIGSTSGQKIYNEILKLENPIKELGERDFFTKYLKGARINKVAKENFLNHFHPISKFTLKDKPALIIEKLIKLLESYIKRNYEDWRDRLEDFNQIKIYAKNYRTLRGFLDLLSLNAGNLEARKFAGDTGQNQDDYVVLSTIHRAKGLEWNVVFIPMLAENHFPSYRSMNNPNDLEEERRIFYVALTRAKDLLYLISPKLVESFGKVYECEISQFISELNPKLYKKTSISLPTKKDNTDYSGFSSAEDLFKNSQ